MTKARLPKDYFLTLSWKGENYFFRDEKFAIKPQRSAFSPCSQ
jgi:hypothetical protein